jgi:hypothetical protein
MKSERTCLHYKPRNATGEELHHYLRLDWRHIYLLMVDGVDAILGSP